MRKLKTIVVGLGRIGWQFHLPSIAANPKFELAGVIDPLEERRAEASAKYRCPAFSEFGAALAAASPDLVVIASPTAFHREQTLQAFERGCDVFCDKPLVLDYAEALDIHRHMEQMSRKLMTYQPHRVRRDVTTLKALLDEDPVGPLFMIKRACSGYDRRADWQAFKKNGGGMLNNYGAHFIDQLLWLVKSKASKVSCSLRRVASLGDAEDVVKAVIETGSGVILDLDINMAAATPLASWLIFGERGSISFDQKTEEWKVKYFTLDDLPEAKTQDGLAAAGRIYGGGESIPWRERSVPSGGGGTAFDFYDKCHEYFAEGKEPFVPIEETLEVMRTIEECRKAAGT